LGQQPPDEDGIETYCGQMALIPHDDLNKELEGPMVEARMAVGLRRWVELAKKAPAELHIFENTHYAERINVALAFNAEAIAELVGRLR
jgi:hypothetical protein